MKRVVIPELLDSDAGTPAEIAGNLADLRRINRRFGGVRTMSELLRTVAQRYALKEISWLDVGGATGGLAVDVKESLARAGLTMRPVVMDRAITHIGHVRPSVCGDALALPFRDASFDVVGSSLFAHHLEPAALAEFAREGLRVARYALLVSDLVRHPLHLTLSLAGRAIYRNRLTRYDAPASVRRAYTVEEIRRILEETSAAKIEIETHFLFRMGAIAWKQQPSTT